MYRIVAKETIEETIHSVQQDKMELSNGVLQEGGGDGERINGEDLKQLLATYFGQ